MLHQIKNFKASFVHSFKKGLSYFWEEDGILMSQAEYQALLVKSRLDHMKFEDMTQSLLEKVIIDKLVVEIELVNMFRTIGG